MNGTLIAFADIPSVRVGAGIHPLVAGPCRSASLADRVRVHERGSFLSRQEGLG